MEISSKNFCFADHFQKQQKAKTFFILTVFLSSYDSSWKSCTSTCMDSVPFISGSLKRFIALAKQKNPRIVSTQYFLHREALVSKSVVPKFQEILDETIKMVNYIKNSPLQPRLFSALCSAMEAAYTQLLHMEVRWLSQGWVLSRFYEVREELATFFFDLKSLSWLTCFVMRPGAIKLLS
jgi:hypothetical protein